MTIKPLSAHVRHSALPDGDTLFARLYPTLVAAGEIALSHFHTPNTMQIVQKADQSIVTAADMLVSNMLVEALTAQTPDIAIISEESANHNLPDPDMPYWCIDPIDGSSAFSKGLDGWSIMLSLIYKREIIWGVCYAPLHQRFYYAGRGCGAYIQENDAASKRIHGLSWSFDTPLIPLATHDYPRNTALRDIAFLEDLGYSFASSIKETMPSRFAAIAAGVGHVSLLGYSARGAREWDLATMCIIEEAGGKVLRLSAPHQPEFGNPAQHFHRLLMISDAGAADEIIAHLQAHPH